MVGTRRNLLSHNSSYRNENIGPNANSFDKYQRVDLESGYGSINPLKPKQKFRDAIKQTMYENRANDMKKKLIGNVDHQLLEHFRKSDESVREPDQLTAFLCQLTPAPIAQMYFQQESPRLLRRTEPSPR